MPLLRAPLTRSVLFLFGLSLSAALRLLPFKQPVALLAHPLSSRIITPWVLLLSYLLHPTSPCTNETTSSRSASI